MVIAYDSEKVSAHILYISDVFPTLVSPSRRMLGMLYEYRVVFIAATHIKMFWLLVGIILGIWLDQSFTIPYVQDVVDYVITEYKKRIERYKNT